MSSLMAMVSKTIDSRILPVPNVYPIPVEETRQLSIGLGRQGASLVPEALASTIYPRVPHQEKLIYVRKMAIVFQACWEIPLPKAHIIGELIATESDGRTLPSVGPDRHHGLGVGHSPPYEAILRAHISSSLVAFEKQQGIDDYKTKYLKKIRHFFHTCLHKIPNAVEHLPIATMHYDMGPHNMIVSSDDCSDIKAIIDWEFVGSAPFASLDRSFDMFFRKMAENGYGLEYDHADELRKAFWDAIPD